MCWCFSVVLLRHCCRLKGKRRGCCFKQRDSHRLLHVSAWAFIPRVAKHVKILRSFIFSSPCHSFIEGTVHLTKSPCPLALSDYEQAHGRKDSWGAFPPSGYLLSSILCSTSFWQKVLESPAWKTDCKEKLPPPAKFLAAGTDVLWHPRQNQFSLSEHSHCYSHGLYLNCVNSYFHGQVLGRTTYYFNF